MLDQLVRTGVFCLVCLLHLQAVTSFASEDIEAFSEQLAVWEAQWNSLSDEQRDWVRETADHWNALSLDEKRASLESMEDRVRALESQWGSLPVSSADIAAFGEQLEAWNDELSSLSPEQQQWIKQASDEWRSLSPEERRSRLNAFEEHAGDLEDKWNDLSARAQEWQGLSPEEMKAKIRAARERHGALSPDQQAEFRAKAEKWKNASGEERERARNQWLQEKRANSEGRSQAWQQRSQEEREALKKRLDGRDSNVKRERKDRKWKE